MGTTLTTPVKQQSLTWRRLVAVAVAGDLVLLLAQGVARQDREALGVAAAMLLGAGLLRLGGELALNLSNTSFRPATVSVASGQVTIELANMTCSVTRSPSTSPRSTSTCRSAARDGSASPRRRPATSSTAGCPATGRRVWWARSPSAERRNTQWRRQPPTPRGGRHGHACRSA